MRMLIIGAAGAIAAGITLGWLTIGSDPLEDEDHLPDPEPTSYRISAEVDIPEGGTSGVLATQGGRFGGWGLLLLDGKPVFVQALSDVEQQKYRIAADRKLPPGRHTIAFDFAYDLDGKGGMGTLQVDGTTVAEGRIDPPEGRRFAPDEPFGVGHDLGTPVIEDYADRMPFRFGGKLEKLVIELKPRGGEPPPQHPSK